MTADDSTDSTDSGGPNESTTDSTDSGGPDEPATGPPRDYPGRGPAGSDAADERGRPRPSYDVPAGETAAECGYCGRPLPDEGLLALHRGLAHSGELTPDERSSFESAREAEGERLRLFRLKSLAALVVLYFGLLMTYALVT